MNRNRSLAVVLSAGLALAGTAGAQPPAADVPAQIASLVKVTLYSQQERSDAEDVWNAAEAFYAARGFQPAWLSAGGREAARVLIERMAAARADGLPASDYDADTWRRRLADADDRNLAEGVRFDVQLSAALLRFASDLALGVADRNSSRRSLDLPRLLAEVDDAPSAKDAIRTMEPPHAGYRALRRGLARYRALEADGGWGRVPEGVLLRAGEDDEDGNDEGEVADAAAAETIAAVCRRLIATGELAAGSADRECAGGPDEEPSYGTALEEAVRRFQTRHGLLTDGIVGPNTIAAMNVPVEERIAQILVNMDRWRRLPDDLGTRHVHVNIAGFHLEAVDNGRAALSMKVVAGEPETPTPIMSDEISYLEFRPYWNIPSSITENELLPKIARDPGYLAQQRMEVVDGWDEPARIIDPSRVDWQAALHDFPYRLRQQPGPHNSLGLVKFMFPNPYAVYLHDTPATHRFEERRRAFSHGCVRVEDPVGLAHFLLRDDGDWSRSDIRAAMHGGGRQVVPLPEPVPVHLSYFTAWMDDQDAVQFRHDMYGLDDDDRRAFERIQTTESTLPPAAEGH